MANTCGNYLLQTALLQFSYKNLLYAFRFFKDFPSRMKFNKLIFKMYFLICNERGYYDVFQKTNSLKLYKLLHNRFLYNEFYRNFKQFPDKVVIKFLVHEYFFLNRAPFRINYRLYFFKKGFYSLFNLNSRGNTTKSTLEFFFSGYRYFLKFFSKWFLPICLAVCFVYYSMCMQSLPSARIAFVWISLFSVVYLLISGFVFFFKKYQYGKFTSVIQRFWKRSLILFWLIEGFLLLVFFYLTLNSTWYLFNVSDQSQLFRHFLFSWRLFLLKIIPTTILLLLTYILLLNNKWQPFSKNTLLLIIITSLIIFITWVEFYQYYHVISYTHGKTWFYTREESDWVVEQDLRKTLASKSLVNVMLILKFWHVLFVVGMWLFFVLRSHESDRIRYPLIAGNFLNFAMLYILGWVYMYPWFRFLPQKYFSYTYRWFYQNNRVLGWRLFFNDLQLFIISLTDIKYLWLNYYNLPVLKQSPFFYFKPSNNLNGFVDFNKRFNGNVIKTDLGAHVLKNQFLGGLGERFIGPLAYAWKNAGIFFTKQVKFIHLINY